MKVTNKTPFADAVVVRVARAARRWIRDHLTPPAAALCLPTEIVVRIPKPEPVDVLTNFTPQLLFFTCCSLILIKVGQRRFRRHNGVRQFSSVHIATEVGLNMTLDEMTVLSVLERAGVDLNRLPAKRT